MVELAGLIILGIFSQWLAWKLKIPAILPLIVIGLMIGPLSTFVMPGGTKLIDGDDIFQGELLFDFIGIAVAVILFEGGLTLKLKEVRGLASTVRNMLIIGPLISLLGGTAAAYFLLDLDIRIAILFGSLIIVTGPTVIGPILRNVRLNQNINTVLKWEGILIDPIGALIAILVFEYLVSGSPDEPVTLNALQGFLITVSSGLVIGIGIALVTFYLLKKKQLPKHLINVGVLTLVVICFTLSELFHEESGLLGVTIMGMLLANLRLDDLKEIASFKEDIVIILISLLFLLLSSRIDVRDIEVLGFGSFLVFIVVVFVLRPLTIFLSTIGSHLSLNEKLFISWISPRGIVAAGIASIFTISLTGEDGTGGGIPDANYLLPLTFLIILGTVILQGITAKPVARILHVLRSEPQGVLFLGANEAARFLAKFLQDNGVPVLLADTSKSAIRDARLLDLPVHEGSLLVEGALDNIDISPYGQFLALTSNSEINILSIKILNHEFDHGNCYRLISRSEIAKRDQIKPDNMLFMGKVDYIGLVSAIRAAPEVKELTLESVDQYRNLIDDEDSPILPLFIRSEEKLIPATAVKPVEEGDVLLYLERSPHKYFQKKALEEKENNEE